MFCKCGCGKDAGVYKCSDFHKGIRIKAGTPKEYIHGHNNQGDKNPFKNTELMRISYQKRLGKATKNGKFIKTKKICHWCGKEFVGRNNIKFCCSECRYKNNGALFKNRIGNRNPAWKGGISPIYIKMLRSNNWENIRKEVYKRDNWTCQKCGKNKIKVHAHHIIPYRVSLDNSLSNLITLCVNCHAEMERDYHRKLKGQMEIPLF